MMILKGIGFAILGIGLFLLATYVMMRLWNWLVPELFKGPRLRFVQALGLFFLVRLLFGFGGLSHGGFGHSGHYGHNRSHGHWQHDGKLHGWRQPHDRDDRSDQPEKRFKPNTPAPIPNQQ